MTAPAVATADHVPEQSGDARLFATPSGTMLRFATLIVLALGTTVVVHANFATELLQRQGYSNATLRCQVQTGLYLVGDNWAGQNDKWHRYWSCMGHFAYPAAFWLLAAVLGLLLLAAALYLAQPRWRVRRLGLAPLDLEADPELGAELEALVLRAGLTDRPRFLVDPVSALTGGVAFGRRQHRVVCLDAGLLAVRARDLDGFRAVVLHELAHLRNRDVTITHVTLAVWRAFLVVSVLPFVVFLVDPPLFTGTLTMPRWSATTAAFAVGMGWRTLALLALVHLSRASVLRARELHADARVALWTGTPDPYRAFADAPHSRRRRWRAWWANHPSRAARTAVLARPNALLRPGVGEAVAAGIAVQITSGHVLEALYMTGVAHSGSGWDEVLKGGWSIAVAALLAVSAWRYAEFRSATDQVRRARDRAASPGLALGLGLVAGRFLDVSAVTPGERTLPVGWVGSADALLLLSFAVALSYWAVHLVRLLGARVRSWRGLVAGAGLALVCLVLMARWMDEATVDSWLGTVLAPESALLRDYAAQVGWTSWDSGVVHVVVLTFIKSGDRHLIVPAMAALWLVPLVLGGLSRRRVRAALLVGLAGGAASLVLDLLLRVAARSSVEAGVRAGDAFAVVFSSWEITGIVAVQLVVGLVVVARGSGLSPALLAGTVAGAVGAECLSGLHLADGCVGLWSLAGTGCTHTMDNALAARPLQVVPILGTVAVLVGGAVGGGLRKLRKQALPADPLGEVSAHDAAWLAVRAAPFVVVALCTGLMLSPPAATRDVFRLDEIARTEHSRADDEQALVIWELGGGEDRLLTVERATGSLSAAFDPLNLAMLSDRCTQVASVVRETRDFPLPPHPQAAADWQGYLDNLEGGATQCVQAVLADDGTLMAQATQSFEAAGASHRDLQALLTSVNRRR